MCMLTGLGGSDGWRCTGVTMGQPWGVSHALRLRSAAIAALGMVLAGCVTSAVALAASWSAPV